MRSSSKGSATSLSRTTASVSSVGTFVNRLTTSKLTVWLEWMGASLILSTKWAEFLTYDEDLPVSWLMISTRKQLSGRQWVTMEYHPYEFLEGPICVVAYCIVELAVCIWYEIFIPIRLQTYEKKYCLVRLTCSFAHPRQIWMKIFLVGLKTSHYFLRHLSLCPSIYIYIYIYMCVCVYVCVCVCAQIQIFVFMYVWFVFMYILIYTDTY